MARAVWKGAVVAEIGQAIAVRFGREGANVAINYRRDEAEAEQTDRRR